MKHGWNTDKKVGQLPEQIQKVMLSGSLYLCMCFPCGSAYHFIEFQSVFHPCFIRGSRIFCFTAFWDKCPIGGKEQARASVPHFLAKPKVRPLPTELQIGSLRSRNVRIEHQLAQTPESARVGRRNRVARLHPARIPFRTTALIPVPPRTREHSRPSPAYGLRFDDKNP